MIFQSKKNKFIEAVIEGHIEKVKVNKHTSELILKQKLSGLIEQLNALYVQTDIVKSMIQDKTTVLRLANQLAASEVVVHAISDGKRTIGEFSNSVMAPLMDTLHQSDDSLAVLVSGALEGGDQLVDTNNDRHNWANPNF